jgi:hypothetical protein
MMDVMQAASTLSVNFSPLSVFARNGETLDAVLSMSIHGHFFGLQTVMPTLALDTPADSFAQKSGGLLIGHGGQQIQQVIGGLNLDVFRARARAFFRQ